MPKANVPRPSLSPPLVHVPQSLLRRLDAGQVLRDALIATNHPHAYGPVVAWASLESYARAARRQLARIRRALRGFRHPRGLPATNLFDDVHFYVIGWVRIDKLAGFISHHTRYTQIGRVLRRYRRELDERLHLRNHLEHLEQRLPGGKEAPKMRVPNALFNMVNDKVSYEGTLVDVGKQSGQVLTQLLMELRDAVLFDSMATLLAQTPDRLRQILADAAREAHTRSLTRRVSKMLGLKP